MEETSAGYESPWKSKLLAVMSYFGVLCFVPLIVNKDDEFVAFHAKQGLVLWVFAMVGFFLLYLPGLGPILFQVVIFAVPAYSLVGLVAAIMKKQWKLPGVYELSVMF